MSSFYPVSQETRHHYPFLLQNGFHFRAGRQLNRAVLYSVIGEYLTRHIRQDVLKKDGGAAEVLEVLIKRLAEGCGKDITGTDSGVAAIIVALGEGDEVSLPIVWTNTELSLKRFGDDIGIRVTDARGEEHKVGREIFETMASHTNEEGGLDCLIPFVHTRTITMPHGYGSNCIDVPAELASTARYVPDVAWRTDGEVVAKELHDDYVNNDHRNGEGMGVEVGRYHGIPISARILFGSKEAERAWRKGSVTRNGGKLKFEAGSSAHPHIRYVIHIADENNMFKKAQEGIDYAQEQSCHKDLAQILLNAFWTRSLAELIAHNPHWVAWKEKEAV